MEQGTMILDEALELARQEKKALEDGEYDSAIEMAAKRVQLTGMACNMMEKAEQEPFRLRLAELSKIQKQLIEAAARARDAVRQSMNRSRQEKKRMAGYHMAIGQALQ